MNRNFKGVWIPKEIWLSKELNLKEKVFLVEIDSLDNENGCYASNKYFAEFFQMSPSRCSEIIKSLEKKGFITIELVYKPNTKQVEKRILKIKKVLGKSNNEYSENRNPVLGKPKDNNINNNNINNNNINNNIDKDKKDLSTSIEAYTDNKDLINTLNDFIEMRKNIKKPMTGQALKRLLNKLDKFTADDDIKIEILDQSILNNWTDIYQLKNTNLSHNKLQSDKNNDYWDSYFDN